MFVSFWVFSSYKTVFQPWKSFLKKKKGYLNRNQGEFHIPQLKKPISLDIYLHHQRIPTKLILENQWIDFLKILFQQNAVCFHLQLEKQFVTVNNRVLKQEFSKSQIEKHILSLKWWISCEPDGYIVVSSDLILKNEQIWASKPLNWRNLFENGLFLHSVDK
jgi:hypothetical protein